MNFTMNGREIDWRSLKRCFSTAGLACAVYLVVSTGCALALAALLEPMRDRMGETMWTIITMLAMYPAAVPACYVVMRRTPRAVQTWRQPLGVGRFLCVFIISTGFMYIGNLVGQFLMTIVGMITGRPIINDVQEMIMAMEPWAIVIVAVIVGPIVEELVFRKFLLDRIAGYGQITAMLVSGLIFGLAHGNFFQFFYAFALGMIFAYMYLRTGSVKHTILLHMMINFCGSVLPLALLKVMERNPIVGAVLSIGQLSYMFMMMIAAIVLLICYRGEIFAKEDRSWIPKGRWTAAVFFNPGMLVFYATVVAMFIYDYLKQ